ncbi:MAG: hypothetical protein WCA35_10010 [Kovacikia sp.]
MTFGYCRLLPATTIDSAAIAHCLAARNAASDRGGGAESVVPGEPGAIATSPYPAEIWETSDPANS